MFIQLVCPVRAGCHPVCEPCVWREPCISPVYTKGLEKPDYPHWKKSLHGFSTGYNTGCEYVHSHTPWGRIEDKNNLHNPWEIAHVWQWQTQSGHESVSVSTVGFFHCRHIDWVTFALALRKVTRAVFRLRYVKSTHISVHLNFFFKHTLSTREKHRWCLCQEDKKGGIRLSFSSTFNYSDLIHIICLNPAFHECVISTSCLLAPHPFLPA